MKIDSIDMLKEMRVGVSRSGDALNLLPRKNNKVKDWLDEHGQNYNPSAVYYGPRTMEIEGFIIGDTLEEFHDNRMAFDNLVNRPGLRCFEFTNVGRPFYCYLNKGAEIRPVYSLGNGLNAARFKLGLTEPDSYSPVFNLTVTTSGSITIGLTGATRIYWGDGTWDDVTAGGAISHSYVYSGTYGIGIVGDVGSITSLSATGGTISGDLGLLLRGLKSLTTLSLGLHGITSYNGGTLPAALTSVDLSGNNMNQDDLDRLMSYLYFDGTTKVSDRNAGLDIDITGQGPLSSEGQTYYDLCDPHVGIISVDA